MWEQGKLSLFNPLLGHVFLFKFWQIYCVIVVCMSVQVGWAFGLLILVHFHAMHEVITTVCFCSISTATCGNQAFVATSQAWAAEAVSGQHLWGENCETWRGRGRRLYYWRRWQASKVVALKACKCVFMPACQWASECVCVCVCVCACVSAFAHLTMPCVDGCVPDTGMCVHVCVRACMCVCVHASLDLCTYSIKFSEWLCLMYWREYCDNKWWWMCRLLWVMPEQV